MRNVIKFSAGAMLLICSSLSQAMNVWVVESGQDAFSSSQNTLTLSAGTTTLDLYYDVAGDISYGYDFILDIVGGGSISNVWGGDSDLGNAYGSGWRQFGGDIYGETGSSVLGFTFDFTANAGSTLLISGSYTDADFLDAPVTSATLATVQPVPVPAAVWLFGSGLIGLGAMLKRHKA